MNIRPHTFVRIIFLMFSWKCGKVRSEPTMKTWKQAVLDCYENNSFLESNTTVLKQYMVNHTKVNDSIWVGSFGTLLPWIEIRGCYNIPLSCNSLEIDEKNAANIQLCQLKCMERRYFAFNKKIERCVCFDEHDLVTKKTDNASFCQEYIDRGDGNTHVVVYKVFDRPITLAGNNHDCLSYQCSSSSSMPIFSTKQCFTYSRSYCRDGRKAEGPNYQHFFQHRDNCKESHLTYPLLYSENLCNVSESLTQGIDVWVGVYRQKIYLDSSDKAVLENFNKIEQYILQCNYLPTNDMNESLVQADNCNIKHFYKCSSDTQIDLQEEPIKNTTSNHVCHSKDPDTVATDNQSSGMIVGIVVSISVIVVILFVILAFMYRRKYTKEKLSLNTDCRRDRYTHEIDNYALNSDYQQLDNVQEKPKPYDQLQVRRNNGNVDTLPTTEQTNTSFSRDEYSNTDISEYEQLDNADKDTSTHAYDQLNVTHVVKTNPTSSLYKTTTSREQHSKHESTKATTKLSYETVTSDYEQLNNAKKDKSMHVYDQLHVKDMIDTEQTKYNSNITISRDKHSNDEPTEETTELKSMKDTAEYGQLDNATKDKSMNVYDRLDVANVMSNDSTHHTACQ